MGSTNLRERGDCVNCDEINWTVPPWPRGEAVDILMLDDGDILPYACDLQCELEAVRVLLHETVTALARANVQGGRYQARIRDLLDALRAARHDGAILSARLRILQQDEAA